MSQQPEHPTAAPSDEQERPAPVGTDARPDEEAPAREAPAGGKPGASSEGGETTSAATGARSGGLAEVPTSAAEPVTSARPAPDTAAR